MRNLALRHSSISAAALGAALAWGALEFIALQWCRILEWTARRPSSVQGRPQQ